MNMVTVLMLFVGLSGLARAEELTESITGKKVAAVSRLKSSAGASIGNETIAVAPSAPQSKFFGVLDLRPSVSTKSGVLGSENTIEAGYQFDSTWRLSYAQWWNTAKNLSDGLYTHDGFFRLRGSNLYDNGVVTVSYQGRLFLPTFASRREAGFVTSVFNQLKMAVQLSPDLTLSFSTAPTYLHFSRTSFNGKANTVFQNIGMANLDIKLSNRLTLSLPLYLISSRTHSVSGLAGSGEWSHLLVVWPELAYSLNANHSVGLSYYSDNLMSPTLDRFNIAQGLNNGVLQAFWTVSL